MENPTRHFQMLIRRIAMMAKRFDGSAESTSIIHSAVANFDSSALRYFLPNRFSRVVSTMFSSASHKDSSGIQYADVYKDDFCHVNMFGFTQPGLKVPLHDHPEQNAVMKVFQGSVRVRSFTVIDENSDEECWDGNENLPTIKVRYEGEVVLSSSSEAHSAVLGPKNGNIHEVTSLEPHTYFCDFFFPVSPSCHYYRSPPRESLTIGQTIRLQQIRCPREFYCDTIEFPSFERFNLTEE